MGFGGNSALVVSACDFALAGAVLALSTFVTMWVGLLSFGTVCFAAVGGYIAAHLLTNTHLDPVLVLVCGAVGGAVFAAVVSPILLRLESHWFALATVALILVVSVLAKNLNSLTGGSAGTVVAPGVSAWLAVSCVVVLAVVLARLARTPYGMAAELTREDPTVAATMGVNVRTVQLVAFILSGFLGGAGGVLQAGFLGYISPDTFYIELAVIVLASVVLGGANHWAGALIGAVVFAGLPVLLDQIAGSVPGIVEGVLLLLIMVFLPGGLIEPARSARRRAERAQLRGALPPAGLAPQAGASSSVAGSIQNTKR
jgi:branched-chain amino acid transport system permease protein